MMETWMDIACMLCGLFGTIFWLYSLHILLFNPVKRDMLLIEGFMWRVLGLVLSVPFIVTTILQLNNLFSESKASVKDLVYSEDFYNNAPDSARSRAIRLQEPMQHIPPLDSLLLSQSGLHEIRIDGDSLRFTQSARHNALPEEIRRRQTDPSLLWTVFYHFIDPGNQHMTTSEMGRRWATVLAILGVLLLNGLLITTLISAIDKRKEQWRRGEIRYRPLLFGRVFPLRKYAVIIGGHDMTAGLVRQIIDANRYVLIMTESDVETFRSALFSGLTRRQQRKIILYGGKRNSGNDIASLQLEKAREVYVLGENNGFDDTESHHDTLNMQAVRLIADYLKRQKGTPAHSVQGPAQQKGAGKQLTCRVMFEYQTAFSILQFSDLSNTIKPYIDLQPFNFYEMWTQQVLVCPHIGDIGQLHERGTLKYLPLEGARAMTAETDDFVHLIVVGLSRMGVALAIEAAHLAHYPNFITRKKRTRITLIDSNAGQEINFFMGRFRDLFSVSRWRMAQTAAASRYHYSPEELFADSRWFDPLHDADSASPCKSPGNHLGSDFIDVEWEFIQGGIEEPQVQSYLKQAAAVTDARLTVAVCLPQPNRVVASVIYLPDEIYKKAEQILVFQRNGASIIDSISQNNRYYGKLKPFGMAADCYDVSLVAQAEQIAATFQQQYDVMCQKIAVSQPQLQQLPEVPRKKSAMASWWSNVYNANTMWSKLRSIRYTGSGTIDDNGELLAQLEHNRWNMERLLMRFRPLTEPEQQQLLAHTDPLKRLWAKEALKGEMAHLDICSWDRLLEIDPDVTQFDRGLTEILPEIYQRLRQS